MSGVTPHGSSLEELSGLAHRVAEGLERAARDGIRHEIGSVADMREPGTAELAPLVRKYLRALRQRDRKFPDGLFADPAWDILLDLFASEGEGRRVSVSSACLAAQVPPTTALRWLARLQESGLVDRRPDATDGRRVHIELTGTARESCALWVRDHLVSHAPTS